MEYSLSRKAMDERAGKNYKSFLLNSGVIIAQKNQVLLRYKTRAQGN